ncbi:MAG: hypothetical protein WBV46_09990 [Terriglobales bacterium]|jgi:hypothetical protein
MARGWESKSIEQQQDERRSDAQASRDSRAPLTAAQQKLARQRENLLLARKRLSDQLPSADPRRLPMLQQSIAELDKQLSSFDSLANPSAPK